MRILLHEGFYKQESSKGMAVERIIGLVTHKELYLEICLLSTLSRKLSAHNGVLTLLEVQRTPLACTVDNLLEDLRAYLEVCPTETSFGIEAIASVPSCQQQKRKRGSNHSKKFLGHLFRRSRAT